MAEDRAYAAAVARELFSWHQQLKLAVQRVERPTPSATLRSAVTAAQTELVAARAHRLNDAQWIAETVASLGRSGVALLAGSQAGLSEIHEWQELRHQVWLETQDMTRDAQVNLLRIVSRFRTEVTQEWLGDAEPMLPDGQSFGVSSHYTAPEVFATYARRGVFQLLPELTLAESADSAPSTPGTTDGPMTPTDRGEQSGPTEAPAIDPLSDADFAVELARLVGEMPEVGKQRPRSTWQQTLKEAQLRLQANRELAHFLHVQLTTGVDPRLGSLMNAATARHLEQGMRTVQRGLADLELRWDDESDPVQPPAFPTADLLAQMRAWSLMPGTSPLPPTGGSGLQRLARFPQFALAVDGADSAIWRNAEYAVKVRMGPYRQRMFELYQVSHGLKLTLLKRSEHFSAQRRESAQLRAQRNAEKPDQLRFQQVQRELQQAEARLSDAAQWVRAAQQSVEAGVRAHRALTSTRLLVRVGARVSQVLGAWWRKHLPLGPLTGRAGTSAGPVAESLGAQRPRDSGVRLVRTGPQPGGTAPAPQTALVHQARWVQLALTQGQGLSRLSAPGTERTAGERWSTAVELMDRVQRVLAGSPHGSLGGAAELPAVPPPVREIGLALRTLRRQLELRQELPRDVRGTLVTAVNSASENMHAA
ncbi:MAG: hypothetical protein ACRC0L_08285, partial [Angustibacter sp.]